MPALQRKSLVQPRPTSAVDDTPEEAFQHRLLHPVSYDTVKREAHARAAAWLQQRVGDRSDDYRGITAEHCARSGEHSLAAPWFVRAATKANDRSAFKASQLALAAAELAQVLNDFSDPAVRERVRNTVPWHRDVVEALALAQAQAGEAAG